MDDNQIAAIIIEAISTLRNQKKRPDKTTVGKFVASKHRLNESVAIDSIATLLADAKIYNKPNKRGDESLYVSKMSAEAISIIDTDEEEQEQERMTKHRPHPIQYENCEKQNISPNELPSREDPVVAFTNTTWSSGTPMQKPPSYEITALDNRALQESENLVKLAYRDPMVIPTDTPQLLRRTPPHIHTSEKIIPNTRISSGPDDSSTLTHTIAKLADSVSKLNQLLQAEREKNNMLLCENFTLKIKNLELQSCIVNKDESNTTPKGMIKQ